MRALFQAEMLTALQDQEEAWASREANMAKNYNTTLDGVKGQFGNPPVNHRPEPGTKS